MKLTREDQYRRELVILRGRRRRQTRELASLSTRATLLRDTGQLWRS